MNKYGRGVGAISHLSGELNDKVDQKVLRSMWAQLADVVGFEWSAEAKDKLQTVRLLWMLRDECQLYALCALITSQGSVDVEVPFSESDVHGPSQFIRNAFICCILLPLRSAFAAS